MHKRETFKIVLITIGVLAVIVINAIIFNEETQDILDVPETIKAVSYTHLTLPTSDLV